jgi:hypothetical protein
MTLAFVIRFLKTETKSRYIKLQREKSLSYEEKKKQTKKQSMDM